MPVKTILFDFGGCLDAPGIHTRTLFFNGFLRAGLAEPTSRHQFQEAFTLADRRMMETGEAKDLGLAAFNRLNARLIAANLGLTGEEAAADWVTEEMHNHLETARPVLAQLAPRFPLGIISNFTGNLEVILREYSLHGYFGSITESFYVGASKPDPRIFRAALAKHSVSAGEILYVGDNPVNDIAPANLLGLQTALIHQPGQKKECGARYYIQELQELIALTAPI